MSSLEISHLKVSLGNRLILDDLSFSLAEGQIAALLGPSGCGKTTLLRSIAGLIQPSDGTIRFGKQLVSLSSLVMPSHKRKIGYVPQDVFLFSDTIASNIGFGCTNASAESIEQAAKDAAIWEDIQGFPQKMETLLGERGINLSGGQKQRVSIARAIIQNPPILLLDDCLSAVDNATEEKILQGIERRIQSSTAIIIAHRVSTVMHCDYIMVLDEGKMVQWGQHENLIKEKGVYSTLFALQNDPNAE